MLPVCLFTPVFPRPVLKQEAEGTYNRTPNLLRLTFLTCKMGIIPASQAVVRIQEITCTKIPRTMPRT